MTALLFVAYGPHPVTAKAAPGLDLTATETQWLKDHYGKVVLAPSPDWEPMEGFDEHGRYIGLVADLIQLIEKRLDFKFKIIRVDSWSSILEKAEHHEVDIISAAQVTLKREQYMNWTSPFTTLPTTIIVRNTLQENLSLEQMRGMRIGVPKGYAVGGYIRTEYPELLVIDVPTGWQGLLKVSFGELDAMIMEIPSALYEIDKHRITNLRLAGTTGYELQFAIGVRKDWPLFYSIITKALASITEKEHDEIFTRWISLEPYYFYQSRSFWYAVLSITLAVIVITGTVLIWNRTLKIQVQQRTEEIQLNEKRFEALYELSQRTNTSIREMVEFAFMKMIELTGSRFGYLAFVEREGLLFQSGSKEQLIILPAGFQADLKGLWGAVLENKREVISNNYKASNPHSAGLPDNFGDIERYINIPIFSGREVVAVVGMGNKNVDYDSSDVRQLSLLSQGMWRVIQKRRAEEALKKSEQQFRDLVESSPNGISIIRRGHIVYSNPRQIRLMGDLGTFDTPNFERLHEDDLAKVDTFYNSLRNDKPTVFELDFRFYSKADLKEKGQLIWVHCIVSSINYKGRKALLLNTLDITRAKELERLLLVQDKMASLGHVAAGIAHEIRNPLSGINIYLRALTKNINKAGKEGKVTRTIDEIKSASAKIEAVIKRVMDFTKPCEPKFSSIDINQPIEDALRLANTTYKKSGVLIRTQLAENLPLCLGETQLIEEVILNLINNSADAMKGQDLPKMINIATSLEEQNLLICISDNGPGMSRQVQERIFEPFFTTKKHSTGIGLSICHRVIVDHNGFLEVESEKGLGTTFKIGLPVIVS